ncbi:MAG: sulfurtransferase TusA family protein [Candidatus Helarchaeota archaeon]
MLSDESLDVKGKTCPMPVLLTRKKIRTMTAGQTLEIIGDFPPAKTNIQNFLNRNGHEIIEVKEVDGIYHIFTKVKS